MKQFTSILLSVVLFAFASCEKETRKTKEVQVAVNQCRTVVLDKPITVCLDSVLQDSRCPLTAMCIWQGIAVARLKVTIANANHVVTLATTPLSPYSKETIIAGYKIELINILPYPEYAKVNDYNDYSAVTRLTKL